MFHADYVLLVFDKMKEHIMILPALLGVLGLTWLLLKRTPGYSEGDKSSGRCFLITEALTVLLYFRYGQSLQFLQGLVLMLIFLFASICDIRTRELRDGISVMVFLTGFIGRDLNAMARPLVSAFGSFVFLFYCAVLFRNRIGGADVKFIPAAFFVLGGERGLAGLILGLILSVIGTLIRNRITKSKDESLPMIPYLSAGFLSAFFLGSAG